MAASRSLLVKLLVDAHLQSRSVSAANLLRARVHMGNMLSISSMFAMIWLPLSTESFWPHPSDVESGAPAATSIASKRIKCSSCLDCTDRTTSTANMAAGIVMVSLVSIDQLADMSRKILSASGARNAVDIAVLDAIECRFITMNSAHHPLIRIEERAVRQDSAVTEESLAFQISFITWNGRKQQKNGMK
jgi:hypothetical protein